MEIVIALAIFGTVFGGIIMAYTQAARRAQWAGYNLAAQAIAVQQIEQARAAVWQTRGGDEMGAIPLLNKITNAGPTYTGHSCTNLDIPCQSTNYVRVTNYVTIKTLAVANGVSVRMVRVDAVWPFVWGGKQRFFTNSIGTYIAPDDL